MLERCKTCGKSYTPNQTMTYSVYGYCSWECLMNKKVRVNNQNRGNNNNSNKRNNAHRSYSGQRAKVG